MKEWRDNGTLHPLQEGFREEHGYSAAFVRPV